MVAVARASVKTLHDLLVLGQLGPKDLDGRVAGDVPVARLVDLAHAPFADPADDDVGPYVVAVFEHDTRLPSRLPQTRRGRIVELSEAWTPRGPVGVNARAPVVPDPDLVHSARV
jgi:hypothetical protein